MLKSAVKLKSMPSNQRHFCEQFNELPNKLESPYYCFWENFRRPFPYFSLSGHAPPTPTPTFNNFSAFSNKGKK